MYPKLHFLRRFADEASQIARVVAFDLELEVDITEKEVIEELEVRGHGIHAGR